MKTLFVRRFAAVVAVVIAGILSTAVPAQARLGTGTVLLSTSATLPPELEPLATGTRVTYVTTAIDGTPIPATGLVLTPKTGKTDKTVVWAHGSTGLADQCAPSSNMDVFWPEARAAIAKLLQKGWTVTAPDYPGLGTPQDHPYLMGMSEARSIIDSVKAARALDATLSTQYVVDGHSQGGQGALFADELAPAYDGGLVLKGVASIAPVSNAQIFAPLVPGTPGNGYLVMGLYGLKAVDKTFNPNTVLAAPAKQKTSVLRTGCLYEILDAYASLTAEQLLNGGALPQPVLDELALYVDPAQSAPSAPILLVQGTEDEAVPYGLTAGALLPELQAYDQPVEFVQVDGADHDGAVFATVDTVADWIAARFG
ncbi:alpha/beta hydrolase family protein [Mangrovihabitans endophyticus]|uniref:Pimeloyl-ACP methyl ester carboxylesterase n=1 Tax=Mangrovihabitans endophyticus TaxID=1751298 RepID=A0A8J3FQ29_9ACTN|nr:alpha/beta fold hydrolase [Mangrovihabitans endophyticus]GGL00197.1 hypothetical protein GCM10012284_38300 [Mangrovihabitans endophyticus]